MSTPAVFKRRLLKLADFLEKLPPGRFDYTTWVGEDWEGKPDLSCGTTACALGWATTMPEFRKLGLRLSERGGGPIPAIKGYELDEFFASESIFGADLGLFTNDVIYDDQLDSFFHPPKQGWLVTSKQMAAHIRKYVKWKYPEKKKKK